MSADEGRLVAERRDNDNVVLRGGAGDLFARAYAAVAAAYGFHLWHVGPFAGYRGNQILFVIALSLICVWKPHEVWTNPYSEVLLKPLGLLSLTVIVLVMQGAA
ncbi:MAG: hypothetical protein AAGE01_07655 [Pseudomonadota bacterium]